MRLDLNQFQFHNGSIKRSDMKKQVQRLGRFNSTMVRLKGHTWEQIQKYQDVFQFHNGAIKRIGKNNY